MAIYQLGDLVPVIPASCYIAPEATIIGSVTLGERVTVMSGAVVRGDNEPVVIGDDTNIQENCVLHTDPGLPLTLGKGVTVGHQVMLHGCTIGDGTLIGIQAVVLNNSVIGKDCLVGAGAVIIENKSFRRPLGDLRLAGQGGARGERGQHHPHAHERRGLCPARQPVQEGPQADWLAP